MSMVVRACRDHEFDRARTAETLPRSEREWCSARRSPDRWLARLALRSALRSALDDVSRTSEIEVRHGLSGRPEVWLDGQCADPLADPTCTPGVVVSLAHEHEVGVAAVLVRTASQRAMWPGIDVVSSRRMHRWSGAMLEPMRQRVMTRIERDQGDLAGVRGCAASIALKEAVGKATKWLDPSLRWHDVHVDRIGPADRTAPSLDVSGCSGIRSDWSWEVRHGPATSAGRATLIEDGEMTIAAMVAELAVGVGP